MNRSRMNVKFWLVPLLLMLLASCTFRRTLPYKKEASAMVDSDPVKGIGEALSLSSQTLSSSTGIYFLENGGESLLTRLWLLDQAKECIDIQYYSMANDVTGLITWHHILRAADRGVKVRILLDDAAAKTRNGEIRLIDSHENIEVRMYNAGIKAGRPDKKAGKLARNMLRLSRRMHNKTITVDSIACIMGGRNIADRYFDYSKRYNFRDRDLLLFGKAVKQVKGSFNEFWDHEHSVPYASLSGKSKRKRYKDPERFNRLHRYAELTKDLLPETRQRIKNYPAELKEICQSGQLTWTDVSFVSDKPGAMDHLASGENGVCADSIMSLIKTAKRTVNIQSPYFITTKNGVQLIRELKGRNVSIRLLTNSLASTDNHESFSGYKRVRTSILDLGVDIFEFRPDAKERFFNMIPDVQSVIKYKAVYGLHSKTVVIDSAVTMAGSFNFDPRSASFNTECIAIIRSKEVAEKLLKIQEEELLPENSWHVTKDSDPDHKASVYKRIKVASRVIVPKKIL